MYSLINKIYILNMKKYKNEDTIIYLLAPNRALK